MKATLSFGLLSTLLLCTGCWSLQRAMHEIRWADIEQSPSKEKAESVAVTTN